MYSRFGKLSTLVLVLLLAVLAATTQAQTATVAIGGNDDLGAFLVAGDNNLTLYIFANDAPGISNCSGGCLENWPALTVPSADAVSAVPGVDGTLGTITRDDGAIQVTLDDQPLYFFVADQQPGDATGQGAGGVWYIIGVDAVEQVQAAPVEAEVAAVPVESVSTANFSEDLPANDIVSLSDSTLGRVLTGSNGMTLYTFANDTAGVSNCVDRCLEIWPALTIDSANAIPDIDNALLNQLSAIERPDGSLQVALNDEPLYFFADDLQPGDVNGQGVGSVWFAVTLDVVRAGGNDELGSFLVSDNGMTLYTFANDAPGVSNCVDRCLEIWPALTVEADALLFEPVGINGALSLIERPDGSQQLALNDQPLYFFADDAQPGDAVGQGVGSVWFVVSLDTLRLTSSPEFGTILVGANGMTLYTFGNDEPGWSNCAAGCIDTWPALTVDSADAIFAPPSIRAALSATGRADGSLQVNFNDQPLYFFSGDQQPGDTSGNGLGGGVWAVATAEGVQLSAASCALSPVYGEVNLRVGPGTSFASAGVANASVTLNATGQAVGGDGFVWFNLDNGAWVRSDVVNAAPECGGLPTVEV